jgi:hypothetical protein
MVSIQVLEAIFRETFISLNRGEEFLSRDK